MFSKPNFFSRDLAHSVKPLYRVDQKEIEKTFSRLFASDDGKRALSYLQTITFHRAQTNEASEAALRYAEGQRALVATILRLIERGRS